MKNITINVLLMIFINTLTVLIMVPSSVNIFSVFGLGFVAIQVFIMSGVPIIISGLPTLILYIIKKKIWNGVFVTMWIVWILITIIFIISQVALQHY